MYECVGFHSPQVKPRTPRTQFAASPNFFYVTRRAALFEWRGDWPRRHRGHGASKRNTARTLRDLNWFEQNASGLHETKMISVPSTASKALWPLCLGGQSPPLSSVLRRSRDAPHALRVAVPVVLLRGERKTNAAARRGRCPGLGRNAGPNEAPRRRARSCPRGPQPLQSTDRLNVGGGWARVKSRANSQCGGFPA
jgi:hypothetical protein